VPTAGSDWAYNVVQRFHPDGSLGKEIRLPTLPGSGGGSWLRPAPGQPQALIYKTSEKNVMQVTIQDGDEPLISEPMVLFDDPPPGGWASPFREHAF